MVTAIVLIQADPERVAPLGRELADVAGVDVAYSVAGDEDLVALVRVGDHEKLAELVTERIAPLRGVTRTRTLIAFRSYSSEDLANI
ncbi:MAG TPA: Lrp/AsnC ligand binding domain-containing protein [Acidimicrobiales bacterium]|nr:Lrp/AsnC ligand binding domain-containing protein [Acidimicrobiales bacterium]